MSTADHQAIPPCELSDAAVSVICVLYECFNWDEERLFVHSFIWQRNCKKRDLFNGSFSPPLGALVGSVMASVMTGPQ